MGYNNLSGTVLLPNELIRVDGATTGIVSGNLSTSDGADVINVPRVSNATNNAILTNVGGNANTLTCESNLTFDGTSLDVTGDLTVSAGTTLYGPINLSSSTGLTITGSILPSGSAAFSLGSETQRWAEVFVGTGSVHLGPNCSISSADHKIMMNKTLVVTGALSASTFVSASFFVGDGSRLTNVGAGNANAQGPLGALQFRNNAEAGTISGSDFLIFNNRILNINGGFSLGHRTITSATTASTSDYYIGVDTTNSQVDIRLLGATSMQTGQTIVFKDEAGNAGTNNVVIFASGSDTIDGQNSVVLESPFAAIQLYCNGTNKYFIT